MRRTWGAVALALVALVVWHAWASSYDHDEVVYLHAAWLVAQGQRPFADFLEQHHPTFYVLLSPVTGWFRSPHELIFAARLLDVALLGGVLATFVRLLRRLRPEVPPAWPTLLLASSCVFVRKSLEVRPDPLMSLFVALGVLHWTAFLQSGRRARALLAGLCFGVAIAVLQKALVMTGLTAAAAVALAIAHRREPSRARALLAGAALLVAGAAPPLLALAAWVRAAGIWRDFWFWNYPFNRYFYLEARLPEHFSALRSLFEASIGDLVLWLGAAFGLVACARALAARWPRLSAHDDAWVNLLALLGGYAVFLARNRFPLQQYYLPVFPLLGVLAAELHAGALPRLRPAWPRLATAAMTAILVGELVTYSRAGEQRRMHDYLLAHTSPDATLFVPPPQNPIFRRDASYFWYNGEMIGATYAEHCRRTACAPDYRAVDERRWSTHPLFVYVPEVRGYLPFGGVRDPADYTPTSIPRLLQRSR